jgi:hypothetical protein
MIVIMITTAAGIAIMIETGTIMTAYASSRHSPSASTPMPTPTIPPMAIAGSFTGSGDMVVGGSTDSGCATEA